MAEADIEANRYILKVCKAIVENNLDTANKYLIEVEKLDPDTYITLRRLVLKQQLLEVKNDYDQYSVISLESSTDTLHNNNNVFLEQMYSSEFKYVDEVTVNPNVIDNISDKISNNTNNDDTATECIIQSAEERKKCAERYIRIAQTFLSKGEINEAKDYLTKAEQMYPNTLPMVINIQETISKITNESNRNIKKEKSISLCSETTEENKNTGEDFDAIKECDDSIDKSLEYDENSKRLSENNIVSVELSDPEESYDNMIEADDGCMEFADISYLDKQNENMKMFDTVLEDKTNIYDNDNTKISNNKNETTDSQSKTCMEAISEEVEPVTKYTKNESKTSLNDLQAELKTGLSKSTDSLKDEKLGGDKDISYQNSKVKQGLEGVSVKDKINFFTVRAQTFRSSSPSPVNINQERIKINIGMTKKSSLAGDYKADEMNSTPEIPLGLHSTYSVSEPNIATINQEDVSKSIEVAAVALLDGDYNKAKRLLIKADHMNSTPEINQRLAEVQSALQILSEGIENPLQQPEIVASNKDEIKKSVQLAKEASNAENYEKAEQLWTKADRMSATPEFKLQLAKVKLILILKQLSGTSNNNVNDSLQKSNHSSYSYNDISTSKQLLAEAKIRDAMKAHTIDRNSDLAIKMLESAYDLHPSDHIEELLKTVRKSQLSERHPSKAEASTRPKPNTKPKPVSQKTEESGQQSVTSTPQPHSNENKTKHSSNRSERRKKANFCNDVCTIL